MNKKSLILAGLIGSLLVFYFFTFNNSDVSAQESQCVNRPTGSPPNKSAIVQQVAREHPDWLRNSYHSKRPSGTWQFMDEVVGRLRQEDTKWAYNGKRGNLSEPSSDAISYYYGSGLVPPSGVRTYEVYVIDIIGSVESLNPSPAWTDVTQPGGALGAYLYPRTGGGSLPSANWCSTSGGPAPQPPGVPPSDQQPAPPPPGSEIPVFPAPAPEPNPNQPLLPELPPVRDFGELIESIFSWALALVGAAVFVNFLWAGFLWFTAAGRTGPIGQAKEKMTNALIGAIIFLASYLILKTINPDLIQQTFTLPGL